MKKALICLLLIGCEGPRGEKTAAPKRVASFEEMGVKNPTPAEQEQARQSALINATTGHRGEGYVTLQNYNLIKTGMTYERVTGLLGGPGTELSSSDIGGSKTIMYQWKGPGMSNMNAMFQGDKLVSKAQFGLN